MLTTLFLGDSFDKTRYLTGSIPTHIGGMTLLQQISIKNARLTGTIPSEIINLWNLTEMYLTGNRLSGNIPRLPKNLADCELGKFKGMVLSGFAQEALTVLFGLVSRTFV